MSQATPQTIFTARKRTASEDMTRLKTKLAQMQELQPEHHDALKVMSKALGRIQNRLNRLNKKERKAS